MHSTSDSLVRTRPLTDPVRIIALLMIAGVPVTAIIEAAVLVPTPGPVRLLLTLELGLGLLSCGLLILPTGKPNAIYLRAFRTDRATAKLRAELAAVLGPGYRLSGIRPPREKTSIFLRFLLPGLVALRYAGSKFMELEAGDDWMPRLWKTYQRTRLVFIDVRDVTEHVHQEIRMTLESMGAVRCVFVVDRGKSDEEWRSFIAEMAGSEERVEKLQLLHGGAEDIRSRKLATELRAIVAGLPVGVPGESERGRKFVLEHVTQEQLAKSRRMSPMVVISAVAALALSLALNLLPEKIRVLIFLPLFAITLPLLARAILLGMARVRLFWQNGHREAAVKASLVLAFVSMPLAAGILAILTLPTMRAASIHAREISAIQSLRAIDMAEVIYQSTYPANGYACELSKLGGSAGTAPSADSAQLIGEALAAGRNSGYVFAITYCAKTTTGGREMVTDFRITATPEHAHGAIGRGFCMDGSGAILVDRNGGTNCTETLQ